jgi:hypothetical protein
MYTPVILGAALTIVSFWAMFNGGAAVFALLAVSASTLIDGATGFIFHIRGIARKPA